MKRLIVSTFAILMGCAISSSVVAQQQASESAQSDEIWIRPSGSDPKRCNLKVATRVNLASLAAEPTQWDGKCVAVRGYWEGPMLFADTIHRSGIAIYANNRLSRMAPRGPRPYVAVGIVRRCADFPQNVMVMGYCHTSDGPYISVAQMWRR
jgi:hypothetical protein